jgi:hypothetical protein
MSRLKVHGESTGLGGINFTENAYEQFPKLAEVQMPEVVRRYPYFAEPIHTNPNKAIRVKFNQIDKEVGLDQGKNGFIVISEKDIQKVIEALEGAKIILQLGS